MHTHVAHTLWSATDCVVALLATAVVPEHIRARATATVTNRRHLAAAQRPAICGPIVVMVSTTPSTGVARCRRKPRHGSASG